MLADNQQGNLDEKQTEFARTIHSAGTDLLNLINDILDLSKIESGTVAIEIGEVSLSDLRRNLERTFRQFAQEKGLRFEVDFDADAPATIRTDEKRLQQIALNLLSNAFKFTAEGGVTLKMGAAESGWSVGHPVLSAAEQVIRIAVTDTGIGIPDDKQRLIFEAFQQADGTTSRKYGGTGLGLSISREIANLLGGEIQVNSAVGQGSVFTLYIPARTPSVAPALALPMAGLPESGETPAERRIEDDRDATGERPFVLIVEDDQAFASTLLDLAHASGLKGVISSAGAGTLTMIRKLRPSAVALDLELSDIDGFVLLDLLLHDPDSRDIPVHVISGARQADHALALGAVQAVEKPAGRDELARLFDTIGEAMGARGKRRKRQGSAAAAGPVFSTELAGTRLLIVDDDIRNIYSLASALEANGADVVHAESGAEGIAILESHPEIDVALIDIMMPEMDGYETMRRIRADKRFAAIPLISVTAKAMKGDRRKCLDAGASDYIAKPVDTDLLLALMRVWIGRSRADGERRVAPIVPVPDAA
jgi:CheY-like chemotaxis protein